MEKTSKKRKMMLTWRKYGKILPSMAMFIGHVQRWAGFVNPHFRAFGHEEHSRLAAEQNGMPTVGRRHG